MDLDFFFLLPHFVHPLFLETTFQLIAWSSVIVPFPFHRVSWGLSVGIMFKNINWGQEPES